MMQIRHACFAIALLQAPAFALAQDQATWRCGGVGDAEQTQFKAEAARHDMFVTFASKTGAYIAGVDVKIHGAKGAQVLQARCNGPLMLIDVPGKGRYEIEATFQGKTQKKAVTVGDKGSRLSFLWDVS